MEFSQYSYASEQEPQEQPAEEPVVRRRSPLRRFIRRNGMFVSIVLLIICAVAFFFIGQYSVYQAHPELAGEEKANQILANVSKLIQLPQNETPTMATITDASVVKSSQPFLADAENGDVLIVYPNAKTAIVYRPSTNKLIAIGPVTEGSSQSTQGTTPTPTTAPAVQAPVATTTSHHATTSTTSGA